EIKLNVTREIFPDYAPQDTPVSVKLTIVNQGDELDELTIKDILPEGVSQIDGESSITSFLEAGGKIELEYTIKASRGEYRAYEIRVFARDFLDLFELPFAYRASQRFLVHPRYPKLDRIKIRPPQTRGF